jgi:hypothetical protein
VPIGSAAEGSRGPASAIVPGIVHRLGAHRVAHFVEGSGVRVWRPMLGLSLALLLQVLGSSMPSLARRCLLCGWERLLSFVVVMLKEGWY